MNYNLDPFIEGLKEFHISLSDHQMKQFIQYYEMLIEKNKVMNLTAITDFDEVIIKHFLDSLSLVKVIDLQENLSLLDLGTGAGFPGIPLKIAFPNLKITLADSLQKRILFLRDVIQQLGITDIEAIHCRAEEYARQNHIRETFDLCVSRAVANLSTLSEYCLPFVKSNGLFISYKSGEIDEEVKNANHAIHVLGGKVIHIERFNLGESKRSFICIKKIKNTPNIYPRKAGTPSKNPL